MVNTIWFRCLEITGKIEVPSTRRRWPELIELFFLKLLYFYSIFIVLFLACITIMRIDLPRAWLVALNLIIIRVAQFRAPKTRPHQKKHCWRICGTGFWEREWQNNYISNVLIIFIINGYIFWLYLKKYNYIY